MTNLTLMPKDWLEAPDAIVAELSESGATDIVIDASNCQSLGAQTAQILLMARNHARAQGAELRLVNATPSLNKELALLGLADDFSQTEG